MPCLKARTKGQTQKYAKEKHQPNATDEPITPSKYGYLLNLLTRHY